MENTFKAPQGVLRVLILALASRSPVTGTEIINEIKKVTRSEWVPSPGSVYYLIGELKRDGLLMATPGSDEKRYIATSRGEDEIEKTRSTFRSGLVKNAIVLSTLAAMVDPESAARMKLIRLILEAPQERIQVLAQTMTEGSKSA